MAAKPEWGTKQTCPKCGERFYDLGSNKPVVCIACETSWTPEPVLKSKQPMAAAPKPKEPAVEKAEDVDADADIVEVKVAADDDDDKEADDKEDDGVLGDVSLDDDNTDLTAVADGKPDTGDGA